MYFEAGGQRRLRNATPGHRKRQAGEGVVEGAQGRTSRKRTRGSTTMAIAMLALFAWPPEIPLQARVLDQDGMSKGGCGCRHQAVPARNRRKQSCGRGTRSGPPTDLHADTAGGLVGYAHASHVTTSRARDCRGVLARTHRGALRPGAAHATSPTQDLQHSANTRMCVAGRGDGQ